MDLPSEDIVWMLILTLCSSPVGDSTFPSAGFTGPVESGKTELCPSPGAWHQSGQCSKGWMGVMGGGDRLFSWQHWISHEETAPWELCTRTLLEQWHSPGSLRVLRGLRGISATGEGLWPLVQLLWAVTSRTVPQLSWEAHTASVSPELLSPCPVPVPGQSTPRESAGTQLHVPAAPRASLHLTTQHNTGALTSNSFSSNVFSRCCGITSLNPFWSARNWASIPRKNRQFT